MAISIQPAPYICFESDHIIEPRQACVPKVLEAVVNFFLWIAKAIYNAVCWIYDRLICCRHPSNGYYAKGSFCSTDHSIQAADPSLTLAEKRQKALHRLHEIHARLQNNSIQFDVPETILNFDFDAALAPYNKTQDLNELLNIFEYAGVDATDPTDTPERFWQKRVELSWARHIYSEHSQGHHLYAKESLSLLADIWMIKKAKAERGEYDVAELKAEIRLQIDNVIDAHRNCVDQVNSQLESILLDVLASELEPDSNRSKIQLLAAHSLYKYRSNLVKKITRDQNPLESHMSDLERVIKERIGYAIGLGGTLTRTGAALSGFPNLSERANDVKDEFLRMYNSDLQGPLGYLQSELQTYYGQMSLRNLRAEMLKAVMAEYDIANGYNNDLVPVDPVVADFVQTASRAEEDGFIGALSWNEAGVLWFMEQTGLIKELENVR